MLLLLLLRSNVRSPGATNAANSPSTIGSAAPGQLMCNRGQT